MKYDDRGSKPINDAPNVYYNKNDAVKDELGTKTFDAGRDRFYQTVVFSTPVLGSKRIHNKQISDGHKRLFDDSDVSLITEGIKMLSVGKCPIDKFKISTPDTGLGTMPFDSRTKEETLARASIPLETKSQAIECSSPDVKNWGRFETLSLNMKTKEYVRVKRSARIKA